MPDVEGQTTFPWDVRRPEHKHFLSIEQQSVFEFHKKFGCEYNTKPTMPDTDTLMLRTRVIHEEDSEFHAAASNKNMVEMVDALCDILYVVYGTAVTMGVDLGPIFDEVQRSNMTKDGGGKDSSGKIKKGPDFEPPDIIGQLRKQGWNGV